MYEIKAYQGFNDIKFGESSIEIEKCMNDRLSKFKKIRMTIPKLMHMRIFLFTMTKKENVKR